jgi:O-antigen/teichoic acid export membrane protein
MPPGNPANTHTQNILTFLLRGVSTSLSVRVVGQALGLLGHMLFSSALGPASYGMYSVVLAWCMLLVVPTKFGMDHVVLRYAPVFMSRGETGRLLSLYRFCVFFVLLTSALVGLVLLATTAIKPDIFGIHSIEDAIWVTLLVASMAFMGVFSNFFRAAHKIFLSQFYEAVLRSVLVVIPLLIFLALGMNIALQQAFIITAAGAAIACIAMMWSIYRLLFPTPGTVPTRPDFNAWLGLSWPIFLIAVCQQLMAQGNLLVLGWLAPAAEAGTFAVAVRISAFVVFILAAVSAINGPMISVAHEAGERDRLRRIATLSARSSFLCAVVIALLLLGFGEQIISLFGNGYENAYLPLSILILGGLVNAFTGTVGHLLNMTGLQFVTLKILSLATVCNLLVAIILVPLYGAVGAAWAAAASVSLSNVMMVVTVWRRYGIDATALGLNGRAAE